MKLLYKYIRELKSLGKPIIIMGDFNVIPQEIDCKSPQKWKNDALFDKQVRSIFFKIFPNEIHDNKVMWKAVKMVKPTFGVFLDLNKEKN